MTFWLLVLALDFGGGEISPNKLVLIHDFKNHFEIEDDMFGDLLKQAASMHKELEKIATIIFE